MTNYKEYRKWNKRKEDLVKLAESNEVLMEEINLVFENTSAKYDLESEYERFGENEVNLYIFDNTIGGFCLLTDDQRNDAVAKKEIEERENQEIERKRLIEENRIREIVENELERKRYNEPMVYITSAEEAVEKDVEVKITTPPDKIDKFEIVGKIVSLVMYTLLVITFTLILSGFFPNF